MSHIWLAWQIRIVLHSCSVVVVVSGMCERTNRSRLGIQEEGTLKSISGRGGIQSCRTGPYQKTDVFFEHLSIKPYSSSDQDKIMNLKMSPLCLLLSVAYYFE